mgnify:CR=1 FL=1
MNRTFIFLFLFLTVFRGTLLRAQIPDSLQTDSTKERSTILRREFLPQGHLFAPILLDPLESQVYASVLPGYWTEGRRYDGTIVPFAFGLRKPFWRWNKSESRASEFAIDVASFTQFEIYQQDNRQRRRLVNTDYRVGFWYNLRRIGVNQTVHSWRFRVYHLSSHLGDDYLIKNQINYYLPNPVNYEQFDVTYSYERHGLRLYGGPGIVLRKAEERKPLSAQAGLYYRQPNRARGRFVGGLDVKVWQQTDFRPGVKGGIGYEFGRPDRNLTFLLEGYRGFRPYSLYESEKTRWIGVGVYFSPI